MPKDYDFIPLLKALEKYDHYFLFHKYKHNYDYQLALLMMGNKFYMTNQSIVFAESEAIFSPVSQVNYEYYNDKEPLLSILENDVNIQVIIGQDGIAFGLAQQPSLTDYADSVDTMAFMVGL